MGAAAVVAVGAAAVVAVGTAGWLPSRRWRDIYQCRWGYLPPSSAGTGDSASPSPAKHQRFALPSRRPVLSRRLSCPPLPLFDPGQWPVHTIYGLHPTAVVTAVVTAVQAAAVAALSGAYAEVVHPTVVGEASGGVDSSSCQVCFVHACTRVLFVCSENTRTSFRACFKNARAID